MIQSSVFGECRGGCRAPWLGRSIPDSGTGLEKRAKKAWVAIHSDSAKIAQPTHFGHPSDLLIL
jgi:hypothetical protein